MTRPVRLVHLFSYGRSGSTLFGNALGSVPGYASVGESFKFPNRGWRDGQRCACGEHLDGCEVWGQVIDHLRGEGHTGESLSALQSVAMNRGDSWRWLTGRLTTPQREFRDAMESMLVAAASSNGASTIVDSTEQLPWAAMIRTMPSIDVQTVAMVRDPRATAFSWGKKKRRSIHADEEGYLPTFSPFVVAGAAVLWDWIGLVLRRREPGLFRVRYEDFAARPREVLRDAIERLDGPSGAVDELFDGDGKLVLELNHTFSGNPSRFRWGPVAIRLDDQWRRSMARRDRALVTTLAWPVLLRHGYFRRT